MVSRDVIFDEENTWNWSEQRPTSIIISDEAEEEGEQVQHQEISTNEASITKSPITCVRKKLAWMTDYEVTDFNQSEDLATHFALFSDCDPLSFEEAIQHSKWKKKAMDNEIASIIKNKTWELTDPKP